MEQSMTATEAARLIDWLKSKGKLGGQHKVPRLSNSRKNMDELLEMNHKENE